MKKETIKTLIIGVLAGIIITGGATSVIAYSINSNSVDFRSSDSAWKVNSVSDAIDDLYIKKTGDNYSTEERVVGTWINGKPIYQISMVVNLVNNVEFDVENLKIDELVDITGKVLHTNGNTAKLPYGAGNGDYVHLFLVQDHESIRCVLAGSWNVAPATITIQYTKTTDQVPSQNNEG